MLPILRSTVENNLKLRSSQFSAATFSNGTYFKGVIKALAGIQGSQANPIATEDFHIVKSGETLLTSKVFTHTGMSQTS